MFKNFCGKSFIKNFVLLPFFIAQALPSYNWTKNLTGNLSRYAFYSYNEIVGYGFFFSYLFGLIGIGVYLQSGKGLPLVIGYFLIVQVFLVAILPGPFTILLFILVALMSAGATYGVYFRD